MGTDAAASRETTTLKTLIAAKAGRRAIADFLDGMSAEDRMSEALALHGSEVGRLYHAVAGGRTLAPTDFVAKDTPVGTTVIFQGRNSLPMFSSFQKRFARVASGQVVGYNHQTWAFATGPGFFVVQPASDDSDVPDELYFDYTTEPDEAPGGWPRYKPNDSGLSTLVYKNMKDYIREVATDVVVGVAYKLGKNQNQFFVLCRHGE
jgi:hypothetical protein